jgi:flagellar basal-body rod modification protein FlgD
MPISAISNSNAATAPLAKKGEGTTLGQADFMRLMTTQLTQQDPLNPIDNQAMVAQMAQFSSLAGVTTTNERLQGISDQMRDQTEILRQLVALSNPYVPTPASGNTAAPNSQ